MYNKIILLISKDILLILGYVLQELKTEVISQQDCSLGKNTCFQIWWSEFNPRDTQLKKKNDLWELFSNLHTH